MKTYSRINKVQLESTNLPREFINSCRLCLTNILDIPSVDIFNFDKKLTKKKIKFCTGLDVSDGDGLPSKICEKCYMSITNFYSFKNLCISNDLKLQKYSKVPRITHPDLNIQSDEESQINIPANLPINKDVISLVEENYNTVAFLLEEDNIHPDAPDDVIFQIKKDYIGTEMLCQGKHQEILKEISTSKNLEKKNEPQSPYQPVQQRLLETQPRSYTCRECSQSFSRTDRLICHEKQVHNIQRLYCSYCSKSFVSKSLIERHMRTHTGSKPFRCSVCTKSFSQKESMNRHFARLHCEKKYECDKCPKVFTSREGLKSHFFTHHTVRTNEDFYRYKCKYCTKSFCHSSGLSRHLLTHTGVLFTCKICQKGFSDGSCLRRHSLMVHREENHQHPYVVGLIQQIQATNNLKTANTNGKIARQDQNLLPCG